MLYSKNVYFASKVTIVGKSASLKKVKIVFLVCCHISITLGHHLLWYFKK